MRHVPVGACADRTADDARSIASAAAVRLPRMGRSSVHAAALLAALMTAALALLPSTAVARVSPGDASATRAYLQADYAATRTEVSNFPTSIAAVEKLAAQVRAECPGALADAPRSTSGAPVNPSAEALVEEELDAVLGAAANTESVRRQHVASLIARLRWSNAALTRLIHAQADGEAERAATPPPRLCADMRSWVASGYQVVPAATQSYLLHEFAIAAKTEGKEATIKRKLAAYESPADKRIAHRLAALEKSHLHPLLKQLLLAADKVGEALLMPAPGG
jgi:hypothetical protein